MNVELKLNLQESQFKFLSNHKDYGFESQETMIQSALERLRRELEQQNLEDQELDESAKLYAEVYAEDSELQELTEAACADFLE
jgi:ABC-type phosphate transport system auxiliary subunit